MITKLSIVVPVYKAQQFIARCIESILNQTFRDFELLLIDDGSPDLSGEICDKYALSDSRIKVIHQVNQGVSVARNNGLNNATGELIIFIDSDDWVESLFFETYLQELEKHPSKLVYQGFVNDFGDRTTYLRLPNNRYSGHQITDALYEVEYRECLGGACNKIFQRSIIEKYGIRFSPDLSYGEDKVFTLQYCLHIDSITLLDQCYYHYNRTVEGSLSSIHHSSEELIRLIELEYELFTTINLRFPNRKFIEAVNGRYVSIHKYALISMYRPHSLKKRRDRLSQMKKIHNFLTKNTIDAKFDREIPKAGHLLIKIKSDLGLRILMWIRHDFSQIYAHFRHTRNN